MKKVIFTRFPKDYSEDKYIIFNISNFVGHEEKYELYKNDLKVDYRISIEECIKYGEQTSDQTLLLLSDFSKYFNKFYKTNYSYNFWKIILYPCLVSIIQYFFDNQLKVEKFIEYYKHESLVLELIEENIDWKIRDSDHLQSKMYSNKLLNHWILSRIFESNLPSNWVVKYKKVTQENLTDQVLRMTNALSVKKKDSFNLKKNVRDFIVKNLNIRVSEVYGMGLIDRFLFTKILSLKPGINFLAKDNVPDISSQNKIKWNFDYLKYCKQLIPKSKFNLNLEYNSTTKKRKIRLYSNDLFTNLNSKVTAAMQSENGDLIVVAQHGGYKYAYGYVNEVVKNIELKQDYFISWGWKDPKIKTVIPLPSPLLNGKKNNLKESNKEILLVGSSANFHRKRFVPDLPPDFIFEYRKQKIKFIQKLNQKVYSNFYYRPYTDNNWCLKDELYVLKCIPNLKILRGNLHKSLSKSRLLVLDHPGTTLAVSMAMNTPTVLFFSSDHYPMIGDAKEIFSVFKKHNIYHPDINSAVKFINNNYDTIHNWWKSVPVQNARQEFLLKFANVDSNWRIKWIKSLWKIGNN